MKIEKSLCDALVSLAQMNSQHCLSEDVIFQYTEQEGLSLPETTRVCQQVEIAGVKIVSQAEYDTAIASSFNDQSTLESDSTLSVDNIVRAFRLLTKDQQRSCLEKLQQIERGSSILQETTEYKPTIRKDFLDRIEKMNLQYSYIAVLLISFIDNCNLDGKAPMDAVVNSFSNYYCSRFQKGEVVEQQDSIMASPDSTKSDARRIIIYNPLRRSFLAEYLKYNEIEKCIQVLSELWQALTNEDLCLIFFVSVSIVSLMLIPDHLMNYHCLFMIIMRLHI